MAETIDSQLQEYRDSIDNINAALIYLLSERFKVTKKVGALKAERNYPAADKAREAEQIARLRDLAEAANLDPDFTERILEFIIAEVIRDHEKIKSGG